MSEQSISVEDTSGGDTFDRGPLYVIGFALAGLCFVYFPILSRMVNHWRAVDDYSHGFLIAPLALYFAYEKRWDLEDAKIDGTWWGLVTEWRAALVPELVPAEDSRSLANLDADVLSFVHGALYRWRQRHDSSESSATGRHAAHRVFAQLRHWQRQRAGCEGTADFVLPGFGHPTLSDEDETRGFLMELLRTYHTPRVEAWLEELVSHRDFVEAARE